jgi:hypothetical protein
VVTTTVNLPSIIVVDVVQLLLSDHYDRYYSPSDESDEYSQTEVDEPQVAHSSHEDRLDADRRTPPRVSPIRQGINMDRQQDRRYFMGMYKSLKYTGKTSWKVFYTKLREYVRTAGWTEEQKKDQLLWSLEDKAGGYFTLLLERDPQITYPEIIEKLEKKRFGFQDVPEMSMIQFNNCKQDKHESLEDWADRVLSLINKAFRELPESYMNEQVTLRFCQGCYDMDAGQHACVQKPQSMEAAIYTLKWYQHSKKAVQANRNIETTNDLVTFDPVEPVSVQATGMTKPQDSEWKFNIENQMKEMMASLKAIGEQLNDKPVMSREGALFNRNWRGRPSSPEPTRLRQSQESTRPRQSPVTRRCYLCNKLGHLRRDCPDNKKQNQGRGQSSLKKRDRVTFKSRDSESNDGITGTATLNYLRTARMIRIGVDIQNQKVNAIIDTGTQVTILNDQIFDQLPSKPYTERETQLHTAGREMSLKCRVMQPMGFSILGFEFRQTLHVAPIDCDMLLGMDFLSKYRANLDLEKLTLTLNGKTMNVTFGTEAKPSVNRVTIPTRTVIPPSSVVRLTCETTPQSKDFIVEPTEVQSLLIPRTVCSKTGKPELCFANVTDKNIILHRGEEIATVEEAQVVCAETESKTRVSKKTDTLPKHIEELFRLSTEGLYKHQKSEVKRLLSEYSDVFAQDDLDLGNFTELEHAIDMGTAKPVKLRMRRTPAWFVDEE